MRSIEYIVLERAKQLVKKGWVAETYAVDKHGDDCDVLDPAAVAFCMGGAILRAAAEVFGDNARSTGYLRLATVCTHAKARELVEAELPRHQRFTTIEEFNDPTSKKRVVAAFDWVLKAKEKSPHARARGEIALAA